MATSTSDLSGKRLNLADTRRFTTAGAGPARRGAIAALGREWLTGVWDEALRAGKLARPDGLALACVGSLARGDGGPLSDYDLVLLHSGRSLGAEAINALADRLWYPIWDGGIKLDHSVRTVAQCRAVAADDLSAAVGMLDLDWVAGDVDLVAAARATVAHDWRANARRRLPQLIEALDARHRRHGDLAQTIEPDLKEARGGLRDMSALRALTAAWLADRPHGPVDASYDVLLDVRDALHVVTGRGRDRLARDDHDAVAALLGHPDGDAMLTVVAGAARTIAFALDGTVRRAAQSQRARSLRVGPRRPALKPLGYGLFESDGEVVLGPHLDPARDPLLILRAAVVAARGCLPIAPATLANLGERSAALPTPWPGTARDLFVDLLASGPGLIPVWEGLDLAGVIQRWIPEWAAVRSRPQRSPVHRHTVDRHLVETVVQATGLLRQVERPDLLLLAALLHDIGKVAAAHDHAVVGAPVAATVATRLGLEPAEVDLVRLLTHEHLTLIDLATRRDPDDPATVTAVAEAVEGRRDVLELLRALTEADACAAGPAAWTEWRAQLLEQLTEGARVRLGDSAGPADHAEVVQPDLLTAEIVGLVASGQPHVLVRAEGGAHQIEVFDRDRLGLFADTAGLMAANGIVVRSARVRTQEGVAANTWVVDIPGGDAPDPELLVRGLRRLAEGDRTPLRALERRYSAVGRGSSMPGLTRAMVVPRGSDDATVIEIRAKDRPGLLHDIGVTFARAGLSVRSAHIATYAGQTLDTFYVTEFGGRTLAPPRVAQAVAMLMDACDDGPRAR
ncbi:MAG TPA: [protein-PII] uridylyltransferase [Dermatophilaceae bacterium]|nr:[protein-PII] uridylyltransferase [Dermatophilaceae bacterium]